MPLSGSNRPPVRPLGGVARVELIPARLWAGVAPAASAWVFGEDRARYREERTGDEPLVPLVRHTLVMEFAAGEESRRAVDRLSAASGEGFVARVTMTSGIMLAVGYSLRFGVDYPLRVASVASSSGNTPADLPAITLTLESIDGDSSKRPV